MVLFALVLGLYKAGVLTGSMHAPWKSFYALWSLDFFYIALLLLVSIWSVRSKSNWGRRLSWLVLFLMGAFYLLDSLVVLALNEHANVFDIGRYVVEWDVVQSFFDSRTYLAIGLFFGSLFLSRPFSKLLQQVSLILLGLLWVLGVVAVFNAPEPLTRYAMLNPGSLFESYRHRVSVAKYSTRQIEFYSGLIKPPVTIPAAKPDIILVIVASLSAINSYKVSGVGKLLDSFDELAGYGLLFSNFFANHQASEGGIISLLSGFPPMHFPTATPYMFDEFSSQAAVVGVYRDAGYYTSFLTNAELSFIGLDRYLAGIGIDDSRGRDEIEALRTAKRVVQGAPADDLLYGEALATLGRLTPKKRPILLVLATTSTHLPYTNPVKGPDTAEAVWAWSLQQLTNFYRQLKAVGYFEQGILVITGDHRQMRPLTAAETTRYGDSARARIPLLVIGKDYPQGVIDRRFFQQSDLLRDSGKMQDPQAPLVAPLRSGLNATTASMATLS